jgi:group I intron endonuclease
MTIDYKNTKIYKIICNDENVKHIYVGYSTNITDRIRVHRRVSKNPKNKSYTSKPYRIIREHGGWDNWRVEILEEYSCLSKMEARKRENYWFKILQPSLNTNK